MPSFTLCRMLVALLASVGPLHADLKRALAETNLEKRSGLALENASAAYQKIYQEFGITAERVAAAARDSLARV